MAILSRAGTQGARLLWRHFRHTPPPDLGCPDALMRALQDTASLLKEEILAAWRESRETELVPLLAAAGAFRELAAVAREGPPQTAAAAVRALAERVDEPAARAVLRAVALSDRPVELRAPAWRALLQAGDDEVTWARLAAALGAGGASREAALALLAGILELERPPVVLERLAAIAADPAAGKALRLRALEQLAYNARLAVWGLSVIDEGEKREARRRAERLWAELARFERRIRPLLADSDRGPAPRGGGIFHRHPGAQHRDLPRAARGPRRSERSRPGSGAGRARAGARAGRHVPARGGARARGRPRRAAARSARQAARELAARRSGGVGSTRRARPASLGHGRRTALARPAGSAAGARRRGCFSRGLPRRPCPLGCHGISPRSNRWSRRRSPKKRIRRLPPCCPRWCRPIASGHGMWTSPWSGPATGANGWRCCRPPRPCRRRAARNWPPCSWRRCARTRPTR
ncbi:MAG: hypothetical protein KatS3mg124_1105 [Porticoccaceae bacterium]|nr:MAG: hypothetical protein KatS3mg124_1105 [Porticoccaceae bacterium]